MPLVVVRLPPQVEIFWKSLWPIFEDMERALSIVDVIWNEVHHNTIKKVEEDIEKGTKGSKFQAFLHKVFLLPLSTDAISFDRPDVFQPGTPTSLH